MIDTKLVVRNDTRAYSAFSKVDWVQEVLDRGMGLLSGLPGICKWEWDDLKVKVEETDEGMVFQWRSVRPYDFVKAFAGNFSNLNIYAIYRHDADIFIGVSILKNGRKVELYDDYVDCVIPLGESVAECEQAAVMRAEIINRLMTEAQHQFSRMVDDELGA
jgi:hypothetical protein